MFDDMDDASAPQSLPPGRPRRERSARYPGVALSDSVELCRFIDERGLDGLSAADIASALGYRNVKTNTFSARLSAARQFGLLALNHEGYGLTPQAQVILHPTDPSELLRLYSQAFLTPPLYAELAQRLSQKRVPEAPILANVLQNNYDIIASAKLGAAEAFLASARFAGALGDDQVLRTLGQSEPGASAGATIESAPVCMPPRDAQRSGVRIDLRLWDHDRGKMIIVRAPESITRASFERFIEAFKLHVRVEDPPEP